MKTVLNGGAGLLRGVHNNPSKEKSNKNYLAPTRPSSDRSLDLDFRVKKLLLMTSYHRKESE